MLAVVLYHAQVPGLSGGFVGVDVFFVISGFLISQQLLRSLESPRREHVLRDFYARRAMRILPASLLVIVATLLLARLVLPPLEFASLAADGRASALYFLNLRLASQHTSYLAGTAPSPFQHFWSLAIEEQFYVFWPAALALVIVAARVTRRLLAGLVVGVSILSLALCVWLTGTQPPYAFFLLPTRAWEFGVGALLAVSGSSLAERASKQLMAAVAWVGFGMIVAAVLLLDEQSSFPGYLAAVPVVGTGLVILAGIGANSAYGPVGVLNIQPMQWLGAISYSLYLWHWPLLTIPALDQDQALTAVQRAGLISASIVLSVMSYRWVETPLRHAKSLRTQRSLTARLAVGATAVTLVVAMLVARTPPLRVAARLPTWPASAQVGEAPPSVSVVGQNLIPSLTSATADTPALPRSACFATFYDDDVVPCAAGDPEGERTLVLFGDSHAQQWFPVVDDAAKASGYRVVFLAKASCPPVPVKVFNKALGRRYTECETWRRRAVAYINKTAPDLVLIAHFLGEHLSPPTDDPNRVWSDAMDRLIRDLPSASKVVLVGDNPEWAYPPVTCLSGHLRDAEDCSREVGAVMDLGHAKAERSAALRAGASYLDIASMLCPGDVCPPIMWNVLLYRDRHHLTATAAERFYPTFAATLAG